jgi:hypothetical protein
LSLVHATFDLPLRIKRSGVRITQGALYFPLVIQVILRCCDERRMPLA